jgi:lysophospholipase L1-like esterase
MPRHHSRLAAVLVAILAAVLLPTPALAAGVDYVALGDSYASGTGATGATGDCRRSSRAYPALYAEQARVASFRFPACRGATTADVVAGQLSGLDAETDLVSVTIGGNDAGFVDIMVACVLGSDAHCASTVESAREFVRTDLPGRLDSTYAAIRERAPNATVVVLGYPRLYEETPDCGSELSLVKRQQLNAAADDLSAVIEARTVAAGFRYSDVRDEFAGHGLCSSDPWVNEFSLIWFTASYHPDDDGNVGYLTAMKGSVD